MRNYIEGSSKVVGQSRQGAAQDSLPGVARPDQQDSLPGVARSDQTDQEEGFRGPQVCNIVGISYRQLDYWARTKLVPPSIQPATGSGSQRLYSFADLVDLKLIKKLLETGVSLQRVREAIDYLHEVGGDTTGMTIASDGKSVYACTSPEEIYDLLMRGQGVFGIAIDPVLEELKGSVSELRAREVVKGRAGDVHKISGLKRTAEGEE